MVFKSVVFYYRLEQHDDFEETKKCKIPQSDSSYKIVISWGGGLYCLFECVVITFNVGEDQVAKSQLASRVYLLYYIIDSNFLSSSRVTGLVRNCSKLLWS